MEEDKNYINLIRGDLTKASQAHNGMPDSVGMMNIKTANQTILEASLLPTPRALWDSFWYEGELSCLFADSNVGKSILAVQIADRIARTDNVLYLDFELSEKQFQLRYTNEHGELYTFPDKLYRVSIDCNQLLDANFEEAIIGGIEQMAVQTDCKIFIIDNLTYLCCAMEKGDAAGRLMIQLNNLKKRYALSILVLAHTPKRSLDCPITSNDLAVISTGLMTNEALRAAVLAKRQGMNVRVINMPTIKPIDEEIILTAARECGRIITVEEHSIIGGLGEAVCSYLAETYPVPVKRIGVNDKFGCSGTAAEVLKAYGLSAEHIVEVTKAFLNR